MDPQEQFCHNMACSARGRIGEGNIVIHSRAECRYRCTVCHKTFSDTRDTPFYRAQKSHEIMTVVLTLLSHGCPIQAIVAAFGFDERTVSEWLAKAGKHVQRVHESLVQCSQIDLKIVQADEIWVKLVGRKLWMAMAMAVPSKLWLGGVISAHRDRALIKQLAKMVKSCAAYLGIVVCVDGMKSYIKSFARAFVKRINPGERVPRYKTDEGFMIGQVIKKYSGRRLREVLRRAVVGSAEAISKAIIELGCGRDINTSYIERLNAGFRSRWSGLVRKGRAIARTEKLLESAMWLVGGTYNLCLTHDSLRLTSSDCDKTKWIERTPAIAAGVTDHQWTLWELLWYRVPLPEWIPPKRRGRKPGEQHKQERKQPRFNLGRRGRPPKWMEWVADGILS